MGQNDRTGNCTAQLPLLKREYNVAYKCLTNIPWLTYFRVRSLDESRSTKHCLI